ncbi:lauroyl acyltransferase [Roseomonas sp. E05]|uniref:lysophospholipid acyltransferase family protein n=1 Tax=Roseomonas sp. E05 TaxID=3046310 RepID=UPI0024BA37B9|nr:lauroyl acyltransferase [Roseomonas sp. E05]MDJ0386532.1 lauroyl acyltransferase [Roseomonas sp. E05]
MAQRQWQWRLEALLVRAALGFSRWLGPRRASALGGAVARTVGPWLPVSRIGRRNLELAFPERDAAWRETVLRGAWDNLGRTMMELPHLPRLPESAEGPGWELVGRENLPPGERQLIFVSAHLANWETLPVVAERVGLRMGSLYRAPDNPLVDAALKQMRKGGAELPLFPKGARGARQALRHLAGGEALGLLVDQKLNEGLELPFLGQPAMTTSAPAELALRFRCPLIPTRVERMGPCRFRVVLEPPLSLPQSGDNAADARALTMAVNARIEAWVRARPQEWLWLHRRFARAAYRRDRAG